MSFFTVFLFLGCAGSNTAQKPVSLPSDRLIREVPFYPDDTDQCGPATLTSIFNYWHDPVSPEELKKEIYIPKLHGTLPMDLLPAVESRGFEGKVYTGSWEDVKTNIEAGRPLLAYLNLGFGPLPAGHFVVITGYDEERRGLYVHSGKKKNQFVSYRRFLKDWNKTERWTLLVTPKPS